MVIKADVSKVDDISDKVLNQAQSVKDEQTMLVDSSALESQYNAALAAYIEEKQEQVGRLEDRLEQLVNMQTARLQQISTPPGFFSLPSTRAKWQQSVQQQQALLQRLNSRLETVREIRDDMGIFGPRVEELAMRKLRKEEPELADAFDEMRTAQRQHQALVKQRQERKRSLSLSRSVGID